MGTLDKTFGDQIRYLMEDTPLGGSSNDYLVEYSSKDFQLMIGMAKKQAAKEAPDMEFVRAYLRIYKDGSVLVAEVRDRKGNTKDLTQQLSKW